MTQLSASFRIEKGKATTTDLNLVGPLVRVTGSGTIDLAEKTLALRTEPKLVMTTQGQGRASDPVGLGIPVVIDGPWAEPRIYPDMAGILDNPDAAYAKLKEMGKGLFGPNGALGGLGGNLFGGNAPAGSSGADGTSDPLGGDLGQALGNLIQQGLSQSQQGNAPRPKPRAFPAGRRHPGDPTGPDAPAAERFPAAAGAGESANERRAAAVV